MALIECLECKKEISDKAVSCPSCGCPVSTSPSQLPQNAQPIVPIATPTSAPSAPTEKSNLMRNISRLILLSLLFLLAYLFLVRSVGQEGADRVVATVTKTPIELRNDTENVPASSWKAIGVSLPYSGQLLVEINVLRGNPQQVYLIEALELEKYKSDQQIKHYTDFAATSTRSLSQRGYLAAGQYYIILRDDTLGILSESASDVKVFVKLSP